MKIYLILLLLLILRLCYPTNLLSYYPTDNIWFSLAFTTRQYFEETYQTHLKRDQSNLLTGIVLGGSKLDRQFKNKLANVGLTHVIAASGMNVTLVSGAIFSLVKFFRPKKIYKVSLAIIFILFYSTITGFEPPIVRAAIMASVVFLASLFGRQNSSLFALTGTGYVMLWAEPQLLISPSFLLSFTAMFGQIIASRIKFQLPIVISLTVDNFVQTVISLVTTLPIVLIFFSRFSLISTITNMLVLWTIEPLMIFGSLAVIFPPLLIPVSVILDFFLKVVNLFNREEFLIQTSPVNIFFVAGYYLIFLSVIIFFNDRRHSQISNPRSHPKGSSRRQGIS